jgi:hypothetical protein
MSLEANFNQIRSKFIKVIKNTMIESTIGNKSGLRITLLYFGLCFDVFKIIKLN